MKKKEAAPIEKKPPRPLFRFFAVEWQFVNLLCGSVPQDRDLVKKWLESRAPRVKAPEARPLEQITEEVFDTIASPQEEPQISVLGFQRQGELAGMVAQCDSTVCGAGEEAHPIGPDPRFNGKPLVVRGGTIRSHLKECARAVSRYVVGKVEGEAAFSTRFVNAVYVYPYWVPILVGGQTIIEPHGWIEKPFSAMTRQGPISAFKRFAYVDGAQFRFELSVLGGSVPLADLERVMQYGGVHGYGGERGMGEGRYVIARLEEIPKLSVV